MGLGVWVRVTTIGIGLGLWIRLGPDFRAGFKFGPRLGLGLGTDLER